MVISFDYLGPEYHTVMKLRSIIKSQGSAPHAVSEKCYK
jgi:hypothetical protein